MKIRIGIGVENIYAQSGTGFDASYQAVLDRATTLNYQLPNANNQVLQNALILGLKSSGVWAKLDVFYMFANNGSKEFGTLNWKNPSSNQATIVGSNMTWNSGGFVGGASSYLDTNFNPTSGTPIITQNNAMIGCWKKTHDATAGKFLWGNSGAYSYIRSTSDYDQRLNSSASLGGANPTFMTTNTGLLIMNRTSSTNMVHSVISPTISDKTNLPATANSFALQNANYTVFTYASVSGAAYLGQLSSWFIGSSIVTETPDFYTAMSTYMANF